VITESYFSMDGDTPPLTELRRICDDLGAGLIVDEAHALGVFGPSGAGVCARLGVRPDVLIGTLGKALGVQGAFVAGSSDLCAWLWNRARTFVYSTGLSPIIAAVAKEAIAVARRDDAARARLMANARRLREILATGGAPVGSGEGPIIPLVLGTDVRALRVSETVASRGVRVQAIRPPTVPEGTARLRITASSELSNSDFDRIVRAFDGVFA
jgi:8-amino-7-oxononanoate synthase